MRQRIPLRPSNSKVVRLFVLELTGSDTNLNYKGSGFCDVLRVKDNSGEPATYKNTAPRLTR